jgi:cargo-transport protein YPP1
MLEQALMYSQRHLRAGVVLSNVLLDYYERKVELGRKGDDDEASLRNLNVVIPVKQVSQAERRAQTDRPHMVSSPSNLTVPNGAAPPHANGAGPAATASSHEKIADEDLKKTPENLNRLAARDRAYGLLSALTKSGEGWDDSEAWFALARAHELGGEVERAKEILWWVVRLEDTRPLRRWEVVNPGGYVL